jgi:uncharacterized protein with von Willebrand factor type A (vWA) domain
MTAGQPTRDVSAHLVSFCDALRERGLTVSTAQVTAAARALSAADHLDRDDLYQSLKTTLVTEPSEIADFDDAFETWWVDGGPDGPGAAETAEIDESGRAVPDPQDGGTPDPPETASDYRDGERDRSKQAGSRDSSPEVDEPRERRQTGESQDGERAAHVPRVGDGDGGERRSLPTPTIDGDERRLSILVREFRTALGTMDGPLDRQGSSGRPDLRAALNQSGPPDPGSLPRRDPRQTATRLRLFVDVSRSMLRTLDDAFLVRFLFECVGQFADCRVFFFDTAVTEVTTHLRAADPERAVEAMESARTAWGSGTTIGRCLATVLDPNPFVVDNRTVTAIVSDGWDAGDLELLASQLQAITRRGRALLWLNPRVSAPGYEPRVGGMETAAPFVDHLWGFGDLEALETVVHDLRQSRAVSMPG